LILVIAEAATVATTNEPLSVVYAVLDMDMGCVIGTFTSEDLANAFVGKGIAANGRRFDVDDIVVVRVPLNVAYEIS
jgi:hypothetical protein